VVVSGRRLGRVASAAIGLGTMVVMSLWHEFSWAAVLNGLYMGSFLAIENLFGLTTVDKRRTAPWLFRLRCLLVAFFFGVNALFFSVGPERIPEVIKGLFCL